MNLKQFSSNSTRRYVVADGHVQGAILRRVGLYAFAAILYYCVVFCFTVFGSHPEGTVTDQILLCLDDAISWIPGLLVILPIAAYDLLATTNRFAGPICRLRGELQRLIEGQSPQPLNFRENDHWTDIAELFNQVREELLELRAQSSPDVEPRSPKSAPKEVADVLI
ncbi:hypothetical protein Pla52o_03710 [Novipirellula galeiformis]|uniref:HAMP domain-containing protein n=1 Tax=Novipirellula galeiformis TaxID=2528004 RepID=A0A5C6CQ96_9BACT|nr:hypothetical protein [Novipirellula galeiformis]TWU26518.1 hypothetical protein Pla52o_03710 [Novipirellula galeiformis]